MSAVRRILVFGLGLSGTKPLRFDDNEMSFVDTTFTDHLANYDIIIYHVGAFRHKYGKGRLHQTVLAPVPPVALRREHEVRSALERGRTVCFIGSDVEDYVVSRILESCNVPSTYIYEGRVFSGLEIRRSEFKPLLDDVGATAVTFYAKPAIDEIICSTKPDEHIVGFSKRIGRGLLLFLPCIWGSQDVDYMVGHLEKLGRGLVSYSARKLLEPPSWLNNFQFTSERVARGEVDRIKKEELAPVEEKLKYYNKMKSILWLGDNDLVKAINVFLRGLGFQTHVDEIYEEDLWIVDNGEKQIIIEVKSKNKNLERTDISKLDEHREARQVPNLTGLLIANTFMVANSIRTKSKPFSPNVIEKAINTNVLITRTIDLCKIYDCLESCETQPSETLLKIIIGQEGWLTLEDGKIKVISSSKKRA
jgi:hypothetical protein